MGYFDDGFKEKEEGFFDYNWDDVELEAGSGFVGNICCVIQTILGIFRYFAIPLSTYLYIKNLPVLNTKPMLALFLGMFNCISLLVEMYGFYDDFQTPLGKLFKLISEGISELSFYYDLKQYKRRKQKELSNEETNSIELKNQELENTNDKKTTNHKFKEINNKSKLNNSNNDFRYDLYTFNDDDELQENNDKEKTLKL